MEYLLGIDYEKQDVVCVFNTFFVSGVKAEPYATSEYDVLFPVKVIITDLDEVMISVDESEIEYSAVGRIDLDDDDLALTLDYIEETLFEKYKNFDTDNGYTGGKVMTVYESMEVSVQEMKAFLSKAWSFMPNVKKAIERIEKRMSEMTIEEASVLVNA